MNQLGFDMNHLDSHERPIKVAMVAASDEGGASRAALRLNNALASASAQSRLLVTTKTTDDPLVLGPRGLRRTIRRPHRRKWSAQIMELQTGDGAAGTRSINLFKSTMLRRLKKFDADVVNLHWIGDESMSIAQIGQIEKPVVWTLHDMWAFCGAEHYAEDGPSARWRDGYSRANRPPSLRGLDIERWTFTRKTRHWKQPIHIVTPSAWLANCARQSALMRHWPISVIPNALDTNLFKPLDRNFARQALGLPQDKSIILFGALGGTVDPRKGFTRLQAALQHLAGGRDGGLDAVCIIFGGRPPQSPPDLGLPAQWMGYFHDELSLTLLYSAADVMVVPSLQENAPQTATEAQSCGCPVVAFKTTGLPDVVADRDTGYLARPFDAADLAHGIRWVTEDRGRQARLAVTARERAVRLWSADIVANQYLQLFRQLSHGSASAQQASPALAEMVVGAAATSPWFGASGYRIFD